MQNYFKKRNFIPLTTRSFWMHLLLLHLYQSYQILAHLPLTCQHLPWSSTNEEVMRSFICMWRICIKLILVLNEFQSLCAAQSSFEWYSWQYVTKQVWHGVTYLFKLFLTPRIIIPVITSWKFWRMNLETKKTHAETMLKR